MTANNILKKVIKRRQYMPYLCCAHTEDSESGSSEQNRRQQDCMKVPA